MYVSLIKGEGGGCVMGTNAHTCIHIHIQGSTYVHVHVLEVYVVG